MREKKHNFCSYYYTNYIVYMLQKNVLSSAHDHNSHLFHTYYSVENINTYFTTIVQSRSWRQHFLLFIGLLQFHYVTRSSAMSHNVPRRGGSHKHTCQRLEKLAVPSSVQEKLSSGYWPPWCLQQHVPPTGKNTAVVISSKTNSTLKQMYLLLVFNVSHNFTIEFCADPDWNVKTSFNDKKGCAKWDTDDRCIKLTVIEEQEWQILLHTRTITADKVIKNTNCKTSQIRKKITNIKRHLAIFWKTLVLSQLSYFYFSFWCLPETSCFLPPAFQHIFRTAYSQNKS